MRQSRHAALGWAFLSSVLCSCGGAEPPPPSQPPPFPLALPAPPQPPAPPPLLVVPRPEASPQRVPEPKEPKVAELRSEGKRHALARTADGIVVLSEERGVLGFLKSPVRGAEIRWAGFVDDDAILIATRDTLHRAATPDDAIAGKLEPLEKLDPAATQIASAGKVVVAAVPAAGGAYHVSRDSGRHFAAAKRPTDGPIVDVAVRADGVVVVAFEKEPIVGEYGAKGMRAEIRVERAANAWSKGPVADAFYGSPITHSGDSITILSPKKPGGPSDRETLGLDAKGRWIATDYPGNWLDFTWADTHLEPEVPAERPGLPKPATKEGMSSVLGGLAGGLMDKCRGVDCLSHRSALGPAPSVRVFHDGVCAKEHMVAHTEPIDVLASPGHEARHDTFTYHTCDPSAPVRRAATLLLRSSDEPRVVRLPIACAAGRVVGTNLASFVYCSGKHQGRPSIHHVSASGAITEVASSIPGDPEFMGAESASDGTTVLYADKGAWVCRAADKPGCAPLPRDGFLAARPLPFGRALVGRRGASEHEVVLELFGEPGAAPIRLSPPDNLLEIEVTAEGYVRLWTSASLMGLSSPESLAQRKAAPQFDAFLARTDGQLIADPAAKAALLHAIAAARPAATKPR